MIDASEHHELHEHLNAYLDGELDAATRERVRRHTAHCQVCALELEQLSLTRQAVGALLVLRAPRPFTVEAPPMQPAARLSAGSWWDRLSNAWLPWVWRAGALASAVCLVLALASVYSTSPAGVASFGAAASVRAPAEQRESSADQAVPGEARQRTPPAGTPSAAQPAPQSAAPLEAQRSLQAPAAGAAVQPDAEKSIAPDAPGTTAASSPDETRVLDRESPTVRVSNGAPRWITWLALAAVLAIISVVAFVAQWRRDRASGVGREA